MRRLVVGAAVVIVSIGASAVPAHAHLMNSGLGPFYDGLAHMFVTPEDLLAVVAVGLLAGLRGARHGRWVSAALPAAWLAPMAAAWAVTLPAVPTWWIGGLTLLAGALVAADRPLPLAVVIGLAALIGATHGVGNGRELSAVKGGWPAMAGIGCALFTMAVLLAGQVVSVRAPWARLAARVAGSWIAAIGLLMLGWAVR